MLGNKKSFTLIEALVAVAIMTLTATAILSAFFYASHLRVFSEHFTMGINACQGVLEEIRYNYEKDANTATARTFDNLLADWNLGNTKNVNHMPFSVLNADGSENTNFAGQVESEVVDADEPTADNQLVVLTALVGFRQENRIVGATVDATGQLVGPTDADNTPCQVTAILMNKN